MVITDLKRVPKGKMMSDKNRLEKVAWGNLWTTRRTYVSDGKLLGTITKNPYTEKYEALKLDFKKRAYIPKEFKKLSSAKSFVKKSTSLYGKMANLNQYV